jgi:hypothetical protein
MVVVLSVTGTAAAEVAPGTMIDASTADQVKDLLPPEIYEHYKKGEYRNVVVEFPDDKFRFGDGFMCTTTQSLSISTTVPVTMEPGSISTVRRLSSNSSAKLSLIDVFPSPCPIPDVEIPLSRGEATSP